MPGATTVCFEPPLALEHLENGRRRVIGLDQHGPLGHRDFRRTFDQRQELCGSRTGQQRMVAQHERPIERPQQ